MAGRAWSEDETAYLKEAAGRGESDRAISDHLRRTTTAVTLKRQALEVPAGVTVTPKPFEIEALPSATTDIGELLRRRKHDFARVSEAKHARQLVRVDIRIDGPFGIAHFGDPHVDDDGTDLARLERHVAVVNATEGLFAGNVGDYTNNWIGRLARLYGQQGTSAAEAWVLAEWLLRSSDWLYLVGGNHDAWSGEGDPLKWIARQQGALLEPHGVRLDLVTPSGRSFRVNARHDFKGTSQWNTAHGPAKAAQMGWRDHVLTCGHTHVSGYQVVKDPASGLVSHALRVASYKIFDRYAEEKGLPDQNIFTCPVTIFDAAYRDDDPRCVTTIFDPEEGADYLTFKRRKWAARQAGGVRGGSSKSIQIRGLRRYAVALG